MFIALISTHKREENKEDTFKIIKTWINKRFRVRR